jgi:hypothetical protein
VHRPAQPAAQQQVADQRSGGVEDDVVDVEGTSRDQGALGELDEEHDGRRQQQHP